MLRHSPSPRPLGREPQGAGVRAAAAARLSTPGTTAWVQLVI